MTEFLLYARLGASHIADWGGYDHMLFIAALAVSYPPAAWRRLALLVTAFTVGHSLTLALATLDRVRISSALIEVLIPATILATAALQGWRERTPHRETSAQGVSPSDPLALRFVLATVFGLIHGLGFSTFLRALLGAEDSIVMPLFAFNVGLELGQLAILAAVLLLGMLCIRVLRISRRGWVLGVSISTGLVAAALLLDRLGALA